MTLSANTHAQQSVMRRKRLLFRSARRGTREMDMILSGFARCYLAELDANELDDYEALLAHSDADLYAWISHVRPVPPAHRTRILDLFVDYIPDGLTT